MARPGRRFAHYMAKTLGRTVDELELGMSGAEFGDWMAIYAIESEGAGAPPAEAPVQENMDVNEFIRRTARNG